MTRPPGARFESCFFALLCTLLMFGQAMVQASPGTLTSTVLRSGTPAQNTFGSYPYSFTNLNGELYFFVDPVGDGANIQIWRYNNGSPVAANTTNLLANNANFPSALLAVGNYLVFRGSVNGTAENELFIFDPAVSGAAAFTKVDINSGTASSNPSQQYVSGNRLFFNATGNTFNNSLTSSGGASTIQLYVFDATTKTLKSTAAGIGGIGSITDFNGDTVYSIRTSTVAQAFRYNNGSPVAVTGTHAVDVGGNGVSNLTPVGSLLYFRATTNRGGVADDNVWVYDSANSTETEFRIWDNNTLNGGASPTGFYRDANNRIFIAADGYAFNNSATATGSTYLGRQLYVIDALNKKLTSYVINSGTTSPYPDAFSTYAGDVYFRASAGGNNYQIWRFNNGSPVRVSTGAAFETAGNGNFPGNMNVVGGALTFSAGDTTSGTEFWSYDGTTFTKFDIKPGAAASNFLNPIVFGGKLVFSADGNDFNNSTTAGSTYIKQELYVYTPPAAAPTVTSPTSANVTANSATLGGTVTSDGGSSITARGVVYAKTSDNSNPQIGGANTVNVVGSGTTGVFTVNATGLTPNTAYTFKAYAANAVGTSYTTAGTFTTAANPGPAYVSAIGYIGENFFTIFFDLALDAAHPPAVGTFQVQLNGSNATVTGVAVNSAAKSVKLTLANTLLAGDIIDFVYTDPTVGDDTNAIQSLTGADAASFAHSTIVAVGRPTPTVTGINPTSGPAAGGTSVTITGTNFTGATGVKFGASSATNVTVVSDTSITATSPAGSGTVDVTVSNATSMSATSAADRFTFTVPSADLALTIADSPDPVPAGSDLTYTFSFVNSGPSIATSVSVSDTLPANTTFVSATVTTGSGWSTTAPAVGSTGNVSFTKASVASGETAGFTLVVHVSPGSNIGSTISNTASVSSGTADSSPANNSPTATTTVAEAQSLVVNTTVDNSTPTDGKTSLREAIDFANSGNAGTNPTITFDPTVFTSPRRTIMVSGQLPEITHDVAIMAPPAGVKVLTTTNGTNGLFTLRSGTVKLIGLTIQSNYTGVAAFGATATVVGCTLEGTTSLGTTGVLTGNGTILVLNSTVKGWGLGILGAVSNSTTVLNSTVTGNNIGVKSGAAIVSNSIVAGNTTDVGGSTSGDHNLTNMSATAAGLDPLGLQENGGPTQTFALVPGSLAIDAGANSNLPTDSRVQEVAVSGSAGGFTLTYNGQTTSALAYNASASTVQSALNNLSSIGGTGGSVSVSLASQVYTVTFGGSLSNNSVLLTGSGSGGATVAITNYPPYDQRGPGYPRILKGKASSSSAIVDIGAFEAAAVATKLAVSSSTSTPTAGTAFNVTVTAQDGNGTTVPGYTGTVHFTSSDLGTGVVLPNDYTFTSADNGAHTFTNGVTLVTAGAQTVTATDTVTSSITGTANLTVQPAASAKLGFGQQPTNTTAGMSISPAVTVRLLDTYNNVVTSSSANVSMAIGTNSGNGTLSGITTVAAVNGVATFSNLSINKAGSGYTLSASSAGLTGATSSTFNITPGAVTHFALTTPQTATKGSAFNFSITAQDAFNNTATSYVGTVKFTSSDSAAVLPANSTLTAGTGTFSATLNTIGNQTLTGTDTVSSSLTGTSSSITVGTVNPTALQVGMTGTLNSQTGLFELTVNVQNTTVAAINGFRLQVDYSSYLAAFPSLKLWNATGYTPVVYVDYPYPVDMGQTVAMHLSFYTSTRTFPNPFAPTLTVTSLSPSQSASLTPPGAGVAVQRIVKLPDQTVLLEWTSVPGKWYRVSFSSGDMSHWLDSTTPIKAGGTKVQWFDNGAPLTDSPPATVSSRFYYVSEVPAP